jgi:O-antigen ligase
VFFLAFALCRERQRARLAFIVMTAVGLAYAAYGLYALFAGYKTIIGLVPSSYAFSVTSTFVNRNSYATYGGLCVIIAMAPLLSELRHVMRSGASPISALRTLSEEASPVFYVTALAIAAGTMAVILTGSRAGVASLLLGMAVFALCMLLVRELSLRAFLVLIGAGATCVAVALVMSSGFLARRIADGMEHDARWVLFEVGRQAAGERPIAGHGLGGFPGAFNGALQAPPGFDAYVDFAHNSYLELAIEGGIPALLLSLALAGMAVGICITGLFSRARGTSFAIAAISGAALVAGHSMFDFSLQMPAVAVTFMLVLGIGASQSLASERVKREATDEIADRPRRKRRRRRRSGDRPTSADDSVTPPPEFDLPWRQPGTAASVSQEFFKPAPQVPLAVERGPDQREGPLAPLFAPTSRLQVDADDAAPLKSSAAPVATGTEPVAADGSDSYRAALARWQTLRQAAATPGRLAEPAAPSDLPSPRDVWTALGATPPSDDLVQSTPEELPPIVDAAAPQPPTPPAWPGETRRAGDAAPTDEGPDDPQGNVVRLPRSRRP